MKSLGSFRLTTNRDRLDKEKRVHTQRRCFQQIIAVSWLSSDMFFVFVLSRSRIEKVNYRQKEKAVLDEILGHGYDKRIRPSGKNDTGNQKKKSEKSLIFAKWIQCGLQSEPKVSRILPTQPVRK